MNNKAMAKQSRFQSLSSRYCSAVTLCLLILLTPVLAHANPKYAALVVAPDRNLILYERNADKLRHPASLTKVMTIYMALDAIKRGQLSWNKRLIVSQKAASMPQTNISLKAGDRISVRDAIEAMIVRSANDAAVVVAEAIGGTEWNFALMMTRKARALGMRNTTFRNASGLPDRQQVTTARDMVKMALAIRQHFPSEYRMFKKTKFRWGKRTYKGHNHVMRRYKGADGLKTGYIRDSGFNLITSAKRGNTQLVAVVMGGRTSKSRDNHMITLLDKAFSHLNAQDNFFERFAGQIPRPVIGKPRFEDTGFASTAPVPATKAAMALAANEAIPANEVFDVASADPVAPMPAQKPSYGESGAELAAARPEPKPSDMQLSYNGVSPVTKPIWGIQVGTFANAKDAMMAAANAMTVAEKELSGSAITIANYGNGQRTIHRARLANLTESQARGACRVLTMKNEPCFVYQNKKGSRL